MFQKYIYLLYSPNDMLLGRQGLVFLGQQTFELVCIYQVTDFSVELFKMRLVQREQSNLASQVSKKCKIFQVLTEFHDNQLQLNKVTPNKCTHMSLSVSLPDCSILHMLTGCVCMCVSLCKIEQSGRLLKRNLMMHLVDANQAWT